MKKTALQLCILLLLLSCKKSSATPILLETPYPHQWIFTADASADKYVHMELAGNNMKHSGIFKS